MKRVSRGCGYMCLMSIEQNIKTKFNKIKTKFNKIKTKSRKYEPIKGNINKLEKI